MVTCPKCNTDIDVEEDELDEGDVLTCDECGATVNVLGLDPLELESETDSVDGDEDDEDSDGEEDESDEESDDEEEEEEDDEEY